MHTSSYDVVQTIHDNIPMHTSSYDVVRTIHDNVSMQRANLLMWFRLFRKMFQCSAYRLMMSFKLFRT